jgi:hypothetical protein
MTSLIVLTCPREGEKPFPYLQELAKQIDAEGITFEVVIDASESDQPVETIVPATTGIRKFKRGDGALKGNKLPYWTCIALAHSFGGDAIILEDDVELCGNAIRRMMTLPVPEDLALLQFFNPDLMPTEKTFPGLWRPPAVDLQFTQAIKFPQRTIEKLIVWREDPRFLQFTQSDRSLALALHALGLRFGVHAPELVQHVGEISAVEEVRQLANWKSSKTWPGRGFDAMRLYGRDELYR